MFTHFKTVCDFFFVHAIPLSLLELYSKAGAHSPVCLVPHPVVLDAATELSVYYWVR